MPVTTCHRSHWHGLQLMWCQSPLATNLSDTIYSLPDVRHLLQRLDPCLVLENKLCRSTDVSCQYTTTNLFLRDIQTWWFIHLGVCTQIYRETDCCSILHIWWRGTNCLISPKLIEPGQFLFTMIWHNAKPHYDVQFCKNQTINKNIPISLHYKYFAWMFILARFHNVRKLELFSFAIW